MQPDTWFSRDLPVLDAVAQRFDESGGNLYTVPLLKTLGLPEQDVIRALVALESEYLTITWHHQPAGVGTIVSMTSAARREVGLWPTPDNLADRALATIEERIQDAPTPEERGRWVKVRDAVGGAGRDLLVDVLGSVASHTIIGA